jgi:Glu-tRNA(Gln) amidotransferase subunit E-like FAD-binding protein
MATGKKNVNDAIKQFVPLSDEELRKIIVSVVASNPGQAIGALTGKVMAMVKGKADGKLVGELLKAAM